MLSQNMADNASKVNLPSSSGMRHFKEPKPNAFVTTVCKIILPFWLRMKEHLSISIRGSQQNLEAFSKCRRAVVLLNHSDRQDPFAVFELAAKTHEQFYCIAARECFDWDGGWRGWLFQKLGCFSVERGKPDFHSIATTRKILREGQRKLIVFPEAEITADEIKLHELHDAIFHIVLSAQKELVAAGASNSDNSLAIIPGAIKFYLKGELETAVAPALQKMEERLGMQYKEHPNVFSRIDALVDTYLCRVFDSYGLEKPQASLEQSTELAAVSILRKIASKFGVDFDDTLSPTEQLYAIRNSIVGNTEVDSVALLPKTFHCLGISEPCIGSDLERIERLLTMQRMLEHHFSAMQCCRILDFIECELFGTITPKGWQSCALSLGTPIEVAPFLELYTESKEAGVHHLSEHVRQELQNLILSNLAQPPA